ncbi:MAG: hypothetical protein O7E52_04510 [Candidatus Poribacteria bacterium]|nr:hypothetical protein [Candidatus Poribacteria bacterium]
MDELTQVILFIVFGLVALFGRFFRRKKSRTAPDILQEKDEVILPPWGNAPIEMDEEIPPPQSIEPEMPTIPPSSAPTVESVTPQLSPAEAQASQGIDREERAGMSPAAVPTIAGIPLGPQTFRQGIILAEILGRPKSLRRRRQ